MGSLGFYLFHDSMGEIILIYLLNDNLALCQLAYYLGLP